MINFKSNKGITLIVLIVTVIILFVIAGITVNLSVDTIDQTVDSQDKSEMLMVQHVLKERYMEYLETNDKSLLVGEKDGEEYIISYEGKLTSGIEYYTDGNKIYYIDVNNKEIELKNYMSAINFESINVNNTSKKITNVDEIKINYFSLLGITGEGIKDSTFRVNYETGYVKKENSSTTPLPGYNKGYDKDGTGNIVVTNTAVEISI